MKKNVSVAKVMLVTLICFVAALTFTSCEKDEIFENSSTTTNRYQGYRVIDGKIKAIDMDGNPHEVPEGIIPELRAERTYKEEGSNPLVAQSLAPRQLNTASPATTSTSFPYNYGINNEVTASLWLEWNGVTLRPLDTFYVKGYHTVDNTANGPFVEQSHTQYTLCWADGSTVILYGDSVSCRQNFVVREVVPTVIHDTTVVVIHDTVFETRTVVVYDTVIDGRWVTRWEARTRVAIHHSHTTTTTTDTYDNTTHIYTVKCSNRTDSVFTERLYIEYNDGSIDSSAVHTWCVPINWYKVWSYNVTLNGSNPGTGRVNVVGNIANFGGGNSVAFSNPTITTTPVAGFENATDCADVLVYATAVSNGVNVRTVVRHGNSADSTQGFIPWNGTTPPTPPTIVRIDTAWGNCTTANNGVYNPATERVSFVVHKQYRLDTVFSDNTHGYSAWQTASATYQYMVTRTGQPMLSMINSIPLTIGSDNTASFGGGAFTETLTPVGTQRFCPLTLTSAVLTSNGTVWTGSYGSSTPTVTITETFQVAPPITGKRLIAGWVSYAYQSNTSAPEEWGVLYTEDLATGQRYFEYIPWHTGTVLYSEVTNTTAIASSDTNAVRSQINAGRYGARVYNHNSTSHQWLPGMTHATQNGSSSSTSWTVTFWFCSGTEANHVDLIVGTTDVNSGNSRRGIWNGSMLTADGGTLYVSNL